MGAGPYSSRDQKRDGVLLIVDDNAYNLAAFRTQYEKLGYTVRTVLATSGSIFTDYCREGDVKPCADVIDAVPQPIEIGNRDAYLACDYFAVNPSDVERIVGDCQPHFLLSDYHLGVCPMFTGDHVIEAAKRAKPALVAVMHSGHFYDGVPEAELARAHSIGYTPTYKGNHEAVAQLFDDGVKALPKKPRVLIVDDHERYLPRYVEGLIAQGLNAVGVHYATSPTRHSGHLSMPDLDDIIAYAMDPTHGIDAVLTDIDADEERFGEALLKRLRADAFNGPIAVFTAGFSEDYRDMLCQRGASEVFRKPCYENDETFAAIADHLKGEMVKRRHPVPHIVESHGTPGRVAMPSSNNIGH